MPFTKRQIRGAVLDVIGGKIPKPPGIQFDSFTELKIGVRRVFEDQGLLERQVPHAYEADDALEPEDVRTLAKVFKDLENDGFIVDLDEYGRFKTAVLPAPFQQNWIFDGSLGGGGQSDTFKVLRKADGIKGVLKLPRHLDVVGKARFQREVEILGDARHRHSAIVTLLETNRDENRGALGYVTPLGIPLAEHWENTILNLSAKDRYDAAYAILQHLCQGLALLHQVRVVHRDIKPENVVILNGKAVLIDFGVASRDNDERLSILDGHVVANRFATPAAAHYGLAEIEPAWDSLGLAWLYGFLIGATARPKQFHWRFHPLLPEDRHDRAKALLAVCSHESTVPRDASEFLQLMDRLRLDGAPAPVTDAGDPLLLPSEEAYAEITARDAINAATQKELVEICIQLFTQPLDALRSELMRRCIGSQRLPVVQFEDDGDPDDDDLPPPAPRTPMESLLHQTYHAIAYGSGPDRSETCFFFCHCGERFHNRFKISAFFIYSREYREDALNFTLHLVSADDFGERTEWHEAGYTMHRDGMFRNMENGNPETINEIADQAYTWIREERHWQSL